MLAALKEMTEDSVPVAVRPCPWLENPYGLVSLLDMLTFDAGQLVRAMQFLAETSRALEVAPFRDGFFFQLTGPDFYLNAIREIIEYCDEASFPMTKIPLERIIRMTSDPKYTVPMFTTMLGEAARRLRDEAGIHMLLRVSVERVRFYKEPRAGWDEVIARFPDTALNIEEANICFALERYAACVFHCVQAIEVGLLALGQFLGVTDPKSGWTAVTGKLSTLVTKTKYPDLDPLYQTHFIFIEQMQGAVGALNTAWRNKISHAQGRLIVMTADFSPHVAEEIIIASRGFMRRLASDLP